MKMKHNLKQLLNIPIKYYQSRVKGCWDPSKKSRWGPL